MTADPAVRPTTLLHHCYERGGDGSLHCPTTGQSVVIIGRDGAVLSCRYEDREISRRFEAKLLGNEGYYGLNLLVDWSQAATREVRVDFGEWRRLTWFLLDALLVWLREEKRPQRSVLVLGGWLGGRFIRQARFMSSCWHDDGGRDRLVEEVLPYAPYPLGRRAPLWQYEPGLEGAREGRIAVLPEQDDDLPVADLSRTVADQLAEVPRVVADDGTIFFFHRVVPHVGPEYAPGINHGLATDQYAFYFTGSHGSLVGQPVRLRPDAVPPRAVLKEAMPDYMQKHLAVDAHRPRLHPALREAQYFAGSEAAAIFFSVPYDRMPQMRSLEHDQTHRFGSSLDKISEPPMSVGLPFSQLTALPRLSTEPDERVRGWFAKRREARRAEQWKAFMEWREDLASGRIPLPKSES